jgi:integrase
MSTRRIRNWWWVDFRVDGRRYRLRAPENSQATAKAYEAVIRRRIGNGEPSRPEPPPPLAPTFAAFSAEWFTTHVKTNNKPSSQRSRAHVLRNHLVPFFGKKLISAISTSSIERYKAVKIKASLAPKTINEHLGLLRKCLSDAREWERPAANPKIKVLRLPKPNFECLTDDEADRIIRAMNARRWRAMVALALHTGLRRGELFGLRWQDIDIENRRLSVRQSIVEGIAGPPKNYRERDVSLDETALSAISLVPRTHELVFHRGDGRPLTCSTAQGALARACRRAGLRHIGWHALRHTFASRLAASGVPITVVQGLLGHSTIVMTMRYTHTAPEAYAKAVSALPSNQSALGISFWATGGQRPLVPVNAALSAGIV